MDSHTKDLIRDAITVAEIMVFTALGVLAAFAAVVARFFFLVEKRVKSLEEASQANQQQRHG